MKGTPRKAVREHQAYRTKLMSLSLPVVGVCDGLRAPPQSVDFSMLNPEFFHFGCRCPDYGIVLKGGRCFQIREKACVLVRFLWL